MRNISIEMIVTWVRKWVWTILSILAAIFTLISDKFGDIPILTAEYSFYGKNILVFFLLCYAVGNIIHKKNNEEKKELKQELVHCQDRLNNKANDIIQYIDDLRILHKNREINNFIRKFSNNNPFLIGIQIYSYTLQHMRNKTRYQINYKNGYIRPDEEENAISQMYYIIKRHIARAFYNGYIDYKLDNAHNPERLENFLEKQIIRLDNKSIDKINDEDSVIYALTLYAAQVLYQDQNPDYYVCSILKDSRKEKLLKTKKRTGLLQGIIENGFYQFNYLGENDSKKDRIYVTYCATIDLVNYVFLLTFSPACCDEDVNYLQDVVSKFRDGLQSIDKD